jgi:excisionase family DNA binding protein
MRSQGKTAGPRQDETADGVQATGSHAGEALTLPPGELLFKTSEVTVMLKLSRSVLFEQLRTGRLRSVRQGRARRIPASAVIDYVRLLEREAAEEASR